MDKPLHKGLSWMLDRQRASTREEALDLASQFPDACQYVLLSEFSGLPLDDYNLSSSCSTIADLGKPLRLAPNQKTPLDTAGKSDADEGEGGGWFQSASKSVRRRLLQGLSYSDNELSQSNIKALRDYCRSSLKLVIKPRRPYASVKPKDLEGRSLIAGKVHGGTQSWGELSEIWATEACEQETDTTLSRHHHFCVNCLSQAFNKLPEEDRTTEHLLQLIRKVSVEPGMGKYCVHCEGSEGVKWRLHPPLHAISDCDNCHNIVCPNGEILTSCAHCHVSYTQPETANKAHDKEGAWTPPTNSAFTKEEYYRSHYILRHGGERRFTLESKTGPELQEALSWYATLQDQNTDELAFGLTYRHLALGS